MNGLSFLFPVSLVADNILQVFVALNIIRTHDISSLTNYLFRQSRLACYLNSKRASRPSNGQLKQRAHLMSIIKHSAIGNTVVRIGKMFEVLIVCCNHRPSATLAELPQNALGYSPTNLWLGARTKLVYQNKRFRRSLPNHILHVQKV